MLKVLNIDEEDILYLDYFSKRIRETRIKHK